MQLDFIQTIYRNCYEEINKKYYTWRRLLNVRCSDGSSANPFARFSSSRARSAREISLALLRKASAALSRIFCTFDLVEEVGIGSVAFSLTGETCSRLGDTTPGIFSLVGSLPEVSGGTSGVPLKKFRIRLHGDGEEIGGCTIAGSGSSCG